MKKKNVTFTENSVLSGGETREDKLALEFAIELQAKYDAEQAEREFLEDVGDLSRRELLQVLREERTATDRLYGKLFHEQRSHSGTKEILKRFRDDQNQATRARQIGREVKKSAKAKDREDSRAFGVPDIYEVIRTSLKIFDDFNKQFTGVKKDNVKEIRTIMVDLIINERFSNLNLPREEFERLAKKYIKSGNIRTARIHLQRTSQ
jgi:hypothetical protein